MLKNKLDNEEKKILDDYENKKQHFLKIKE